MYSFIFRYFVYSSTLLLFVEVFFPENIMRPFCLFLAQATYWVLSCFTNEVAVAGNILRWSGSSVALKVVSECSALGYSATLIAAILAYPAPWALRLKSVVAGFILLETINILRLVSLMYIGRWWPDQFMWIHLNLWPLFISLDLVLLFLIWVRYTNNITHNSLENDHETTATT